MKTPKAIHLRGVRQNNLKNINVSIPHQKLTVITGLSGSGKSSLAFETLYAEGQRRYVESLSTYTRQFLEKMPKPDLDFIENIPPAIALEQRNTIQNARSTVATQTEMLDYFRLFFSKLGSLICEVCGETVIDITPDQIKKVILKKGMGKKFALLSPLAFSKTSKPKTKSKSLIENYFAILLDQGFRRAYWSSEKQWLELDEPLPKGLKFEALTGGELFILMDRFNASSIQSLDELDNDFLTRFYDSSEQALKYGHEQLLFLDLDSLESKLFKTGFACLECSTQYTKPTPQLFSFNSPIGACPDCKGFGYTLELDEKKIIPNPDQTLDNGCIDPLNKPSNKSEYKKFLVELQKEGIRPSRSYSALNEKHQKWVWQKVIDFFESLEYYRYKFHIRIFIRRYQSPRLCKTCDGSRLKPEALRIQVHGQNIAHLLALPISDTLNWFKELKLSQNEEVLLKDLYPQIIRRLDFLCRVGVSYLTLNRLTRSLSGGEFQRINLATHLGNGLCGTLYVLDEPTIGLHAQDTEKLLDILRELRAQGNTVVVVEHETKILEDADWIIEMGPEAGRNGGNVVASGTPAEIAKTQARTAKFILNPKLIAKRVHPLRTEKTDELLLTGCTENNLKNISVTFPLNKVVVVTGVSGSGKTTLVHTTLAKALEAQLAAQEHAQDIDEDDPLVQSTGAYQSLKGVEHIRKLILLDQKPIGKNSRSNPATYMKLWDEVRKLYAHQPLSMSRGYTAGYFSFNTDGGRCPECKGEGEISIDMHFMAEVKLPCEDCKGKRFIEPVLDVKVKGKSISDLLETTIDEALILYQDHSVIRRKLQVLKEVGLGYLQLGQPGPTLSGGEAQRLKIAFSLDQEADSKANDLFILDEPTTGLHHDDVMKLLEVLHHLVDRGKSVILIEHNLDVIANADHVIDIGPDGGAQGGELVASGSPEALMKLAHSPTGKALQG